MTDTFSTQPCACKQLRSTTRAITQFFDRILQPSGLQTTQYSLLADLAKLGVVSITQFAQLLGMDRTTLTRNLDPLIRQGLIERVHGADQRVRMVQITAHGQERLALAQPLWSQAQAHIVNGFGGERYQTLLDELADMVALIR